MKTSLTTWLLGLSLAIATPSLAWADKDHRYAQGKKHHAQKHQRKQAKKWEKQRKHVAKHHPKKHRYVKKHHNHGHSKSNSTFSITWNGGGYPDFVYDNGYRNHRKWDKQKRFLNNVYDRQHKQRKRIRKGVNKGQLVHWEAKKLRREQRRITNKLDYFKRDGWVDRYERNRINELQDIASNNIRSKKHNAITRYNHPRRDHYDNYEYVYYE